MNMAKYRGPVVVVVIEMMYPTMQITAGTV
jgi:hypothetical protein